MLGCIGCLLGGGLMAEPTPKELFHLGIESIELGNMNGKVEYYIQGRKYIEKACELNYGTGCSALGILYTNKDFGEKNYKKALALMTKGCDLNDDLGCFTLGGAYEKGLYGVKKDISKASALGDKACELNEKEGCFRLGEMQKVKNKKQAVKTFEKACKLGSEDACGILNNY